MPPDIEQLLKDILTLVEQKRAYVDSELNKLKVEIERRMHGIT